MSARSGPGFTCAARASSDPPLLRLQRFDRVEVFSNAAKADVYFPVDIAPLRSLPEPAYKLFESVSVLWRVLKPRKKIKGLAEVMAVMKSPGDGGQVFQADRNVV